MLRLTSRLAEMAARSLAGLLAALLLLAAPAGAASTSTPTGADAAAISINLTDLLAKEPELPLPVRQRAEGLDAYYQENAGKLLWIGTGRMPAFVARLRAAEEDGLDPSAYPTAQLAKLSAAAAQGTDARGLATIELFFSAAFLEYASDLQVGRFLPRKVDPNFFQQDKSIDQLAALTGLAESADLDAFLNGWEPQNPAYAELKDTLAAYRALAKAGGWGSVPLGDALKPGMRDARVPALRARLAVTDGAAAEPPSGDREAYDDELVSALEFFQARHGIDADGVVGNATVAALNVPVEDRIQEIVIAMERLRWMPDNLGAKYLIVNIAGFDLKQVEGGKVTDEMAVVVGKPYSRTPVFSDAIRYVELNPYWNVPPSIAVKEELPILKRNPGGLAASGFEAVRGDTAVPVTAVNWSQYGPGNFPFQLRQKPGPKNALGRAKFVFPNKFNVYLHDTPAQAAFDKTDRAFSHGCIRLSRPIDLAGDVLGDVPGWNRARIDDVVASGKRTVVNLTKPLPIHITYQTAWVDDGKANFRNDVYEQDLKLVNALAGRSMAW